MPEHRAERQSRNAERSLCPDIRGSSRGDPFCGSSTTAIPLRVNGVVAIDRDAHVHRVNRLTGRSVAGQQQKIVVLDVGKMRVNVEQSVVAFETLVGGAPQMKALARNIRGGQRHEKVRTGTMRG